MKRRICFVSLAVQIASASLSLAAGDVLARLKQDMKHTKAWAGKPLACYVVPAISNEKRLPDQIPTDGRLDGQIRVVGAQGEFVPASFMVFPVEPVGETRLTVSDLTGESATIPAANVDLRVVKCWYQGGTAWHSYFGDPQRRVLVPELLLHDETLITVDHDTKENYLRVDYPSGSEDLWISYPGRVKGDLNVFNHGREPVADSAALRPIMLKAGRGKQIWITVRVPKTVAAGNYRGVITLSFRGGETAPMAMTLRVLPFALPAPKTYYDLDKSFFTILYNHSNISTHGDFLGGDRAAAERRTLAEMRNMRDHNVLSPLVERCTRHESDGQACRQLELMREAGLQTNPIFGFLTVYNWELLYRYLRAGQEVPPGKWRHFERNTDKEIALVKRVLGHTNIYGIGWDEPGRVTLEAEQTLYALLHDKGVRVFNTGKDTHFSYAGFNEDAVNYPGHPFKAESARKWHAMGSRIFSYAGPHTGPENPDFIRRTHGLQLYKADYDGSANYRYYGYRQNIWNDFENGRYRICFVYPTRDGVIDTLHWEGFREGIDDIRYATKLRQMALSAMAAGGAHKRYAGKKALQYLTLLDAGKADLNTARLEMINYILNIRNLLKGGR